MTRTEFERDLTAAKTLAVLVDDEQDYWLGYQQGLRRAYYGDRFGTECEHVEWLRLCGDDEDAGRRARGRGYRTGFSATSLATSLATLQRGGTL